MYKIRQLVLVSVMSLVAAMSVAAAPVSAGSPIWNYPAHCATVQGCIDNASPGSTVFMYANAADQDVYIGKNVSLKSGNASKYTVRYIGIGDDATPVVATVAGLTVSSQIRVVLNGPTGSSINMRNMAVIGQSAYPAIELAIETSASFTIDNNTAAAFGHDAAVLSLTAIPEGGLITFRVVGNRFNAHGNADSGSGIDLYASGPGAVRADIYNNSIWDVARSDQSAAGIELFGLNNVQGDINVVGNTIEKSGRDGLRLQNSLSSGGNFALDMFNNTFSHAANRGINLAAGQAGSVTLRAGFNNSFQNTAGNFFSGLPQGTGNLTVNPGFVDVANGNLKLTSTSKLLNKGQVCSPGGVAQPDAANLRRVNGASVDIGAYERGSAAVNGVVMLGASGGETQIGSDGADIICGYGGADQQIGLGGNDFIDGGDANDFQYGGLGADRMLGGAGGDTLCADDGKPIDFLNGGMGTDKFRADSGDTRQSVEQAAGTACDP